MELVVGSLCEGKITTITAYGAFVDLGEGKSGMVHISEIANSFVSNIKDFVQEGQVVKVKIMNIDTTGKISLSIKKALTPPAPSPAAEPSNPFEDKLRQFMQESESRMSDLKHNLDKRASGRRKR